MAAVRKSNHSMRRVTVHDAKTVIGVPMWVNCHCNAKDPNCDYCDGAGRYLTLVKAP